MLLESGGVAGHPACPGQSMLCISGSTPAGKESQRWAGARTQRAWPPQCKGSTRKLRAFLFHPHLSKSSSPFSMQLKSYFLQEAFADLPRRAFSSAEVIWPYRNSHLHDIEAFLRTSLAGLFRHQSAMHMRVASALPSLTHSPPSLPLPMNACSSSEASSAIPFLRKASLLLAPQLCPCSFSHFLPPWLLSALIPVYATFSFTRACAP